jgi:hypothetical protein
MTCTALKYVFVHDSDEGVEAFDFGFLVALLIGSVK